MDKTVTSPGLLARLLLVAGGVTCAFLTFYLIFTLFPDLSPEGKALFVDQRPGGERYIFTVYDGDTFRHQPGLVRPPAENEVLEDALRWYDADGFREPTEKDRIADHYPIIVLGDSFTEGGETPWVDVLAESLDTPVRNLGWRGFGPLEEAQVMAQYGTDQHEWVLIAYFEGNDLSNVNTAFLRLQDEGTISIDRTRNFAETTENYQPPAPVANAENAYLYPLIHEIGDQQYEIAYVSDYLWWLNGSFATFSQSKNMELTASAFLDIKAHAGAACVGIVYVPSKEHLYFPYSDPAGNLQYVLQNGRSLRLDHEGWLGFAEDFEAQTYDTVLANLNHQRDAIKMLAAEHDLYFFDLTPAFQDHLDDGKLLYYPYDSHWTQDGHELAGETVARDLQQVEASCGN